MDETLQPPALPTRSPPGRRFSMGLTGIALLLLLLAGLGLLLGRTAPDQPIPIPKEDGLARIAREYLPGNAVPSPAGSLQQVLDVPDLIPSHHHPLLGRLAPDFALTDPDGKVWSLKGLRADGPVVLIFYYGYSCDHCVRQLFDVNRDLPLFREVGAQVVALSSRPSRADPATVRGIRPVRLSGPFGPGKQGGTWLPGVPGGPPPPRHVSHRSGGHGPVGQRRRRTVAAQSRLALPAGPDDRPLNEFPDPGIFGKILASALLGVVT